MRTNAHKLFRAGATASAVLVLLLLAGMANLLVNYVHATRWVNHTCEVIEEIRGTRALLGGTQVLSSGPFQIKMRSIREQFDQVAALVSDNPGQQPNITQFRAIFPADATRTS